MKKNWILTVRCDGVTNEWMEVLLAMIVAAANVVGVLVGGVIEEVEDE